MGVLFCFPAAVTLISVSIKTYLLSLTGKGNLNMSCLDLITNLNVTINKLYCSRCVQHVAVCLKFIYFGTYFNTLELLFFSFSVLPLRDHALYHWIIIPILYFYPSRH